MIQMYFAKNSIRWKLLDNPEFDYLHNVVASTMCERAAMGLSLHQSSDIISLGHKGKLFSSGALGDETCLQLLHTVVYMLGLHLALCGGVEHNRLRHPGCDPQITISCDD